MRSAFAVPVRVSGLFAPLPLGSAEEPLGRFGLFAIHTTSGIFVFVVCSGFLLVLAFVVHAALPNHCDGSSFDIRHGV